MQPIRESHATLEAQQRQLASGNRRVQMFPRGERELAVADGMRRIKTPNGDVFHFDPKRIKASVIVKASRTGRENELLDLGPVTKDQAVARAAQGETPVSVVERDRSGVETRAAAGTHTTAAAQLAAMNKVKSPGHTVGLERPQHTIAQRFAEGGEVPDDSDPFAIAAERMRRSVMPEGGRREGTATALLDSLGTGVYNAAAGPSRLVNSAMQEYQPGVSVQDMPQTMAQLPEVATNAVGLPGVMGGVPADALGSAAKGIRSTLPMDEASRMARARELGFNVEEPLFHGSGKSFEQFDPLLAGSASGSEGQKASFFSPSPDPANHYARTASVRDAARDETPHDIWEYMGKTYHSIYDGAQVYPSYVKPGKQKTVDVPYYNTAKVDDEVARAKQQGFDTIRFRKMVDSGQDGGPLDQIAVINPANIRSRFAAFDPVNKDSGFLLGANSSDPRAAALQALAETQAQDRANGGAVHMADGGAPDDGPWNDFATPAQDAGPWTEFQKPAAPQPSMLAKAVEPITSYPETYSAMNRDAREQIGQGVEQLTESPQRFDPVRDAAPPDSVAWQKAKGVGNVALGSLGYVTSPINAALRTVVGKPIEEATGIPKEYSEFAAGLAIPGVGLRPVARAATALPSKAEQVAEASDRLRVPIPRAAASDSIPIQSTAGALKEIPLVGSPLVKSSRNALNELDRAVGETVAGYGSGQPLAAGEKAIEGIEGWIGNKSKDIADRIYGKVDALVDPAFERPLHATDRVVSDIMASRANAKIAGASPAVNEVLDAVKSTGMNYGGLKDLRSHIGDMTPEEMVAKGINKAEAKRIYGALSQDLRGTVLDAGGPDALKAFDRASSTYEAIADKRKALSKIIGVKADAAPERVMSRITEMANSKGGANYQDLVRVRRAIGPDNWDEITSAIVNRMGRDKPGAEFSGDRFKTAWDAMPDNAKRIMFNSTNKPGLAKSVEDIMTLSQAHRSLMKYGNPSGTGRVATLTGMAGAFWAAPLATVGSAVGGNMLARILASPVSAKKAAQWSLAYSHAARNPSTARMAVLGSASENLAKAINRDLGGNFSGMDFMRQLQAPGTGHADDDQPDIPRPPAQQKHGGAVDQQNRFAHGGRTGVAPQTKQSHAAVQYQAPSKHAGQHCSNCSMFMAGTMPDCTAVKRPIWPRGWCKLYERRGKA